MFGKDFIQRAQKEKEECFEIYNKKSGKSKSVKTIKILDGQKSSLCSWICKNGTKKDFQKFKTIFKIIEGIIIEK